MFGPAINWKNKDVEGTKILIMSHLKLINIETFVFYGKFLASKWFAGIFLKGDIYNNEACRLCYH